MKRKQRNIVFFLCIFIGLFFLLYPDIRHEGADGVWEVPGETAIEEADLDFCAVLHGLVPKRDSSRQSYWPVILEDLRRNWIGQTRIVATALRLIGLSLMPGKIRERKILYETDGKKRACLFIA